MNAFRAPSPGGGMRRSHQVALVLLGTAGVLGVTTIWDTWRQTQAEDATTLAAPLPISTDRSYANDEYLPGVGYYHAAYHAWFPYRFNHYDAARGYYAGGLWQSTPWILAVMQSQPSDAAVVAALAEQREAEQRRPADRYTTGGYRGNFGEFHAGGGSAVSPSSHVIRGGFGFSAHGGGE